MKLNRLTQKTPHGLVTLAEWNPNRITKREAFNIQSLIDAVKRTGFEAVNPIERAIIQAFDPRTDILMLPHFSGAGRQDFQESLVVQPIAGTAFNTYTTAKSVIPPTALITLPANYLRIGRALMLTVTGAISNIVTTPGLLNFQVKVGSVAAFDTGNIQLNATAHTNLPFWIDILLTCRAEGSSTSANLMGLAKAHGIMFTQTAGQTDSAQGMQVAVAPATAPAVGTGFDSTVANIIDFWVGFTISNGNNQMTIHQYVLTGLN